MSGEYVSDIISVPVLRLQGVGLAESVDRHEAFQGLGGGFIAVARQGILGSVYGLSFFPEGGESETGESRFDARADAIDPLVI